MEQRVRPSAEGGGRRGSTFGLRKRRDRMSDIEQHLLRSGHSMVSAKLAQRGKTLFSRRISVQLDMARRVQFSGVAGISSRFASGDLPDVWFAQRFQACAAQRAQ